MPRNNFSDVHIFAFSFYIVSQIKDSDSMFSRPQACIGILLENMEHHRFLTKLEYCTNLSFFFLAADQMDRHQKVFTRWINLHLAKVRIISPAVNLQTFVTEIYHFLIFIYRHHVHRARSNRHNNTCTILTLNSCS